MRDGIGALLERCGAVERRLRMNGEVYFAAVRAEIERFAEVECSAPEVEFLFRYARRRPREERVIEAPDTVRVHRSGDALEVKDMRAREILAERRAPPVFDSLHTFLLPVSAARVERERVRAAACAKENRSGVLDEALRRRLDRHVVSLEVDVAILPVDAVGRHLAPRPAFGGVVKTLRHRGEPLHALSRPDHLCLRESHSTHAQTRVVSIFFMFNLFLVSDMGWKSTDSSGFDTASQGGGDKPWRTSAP
ncbi:MAG: hypothetical protein BWX70_03060 [Verrucomicrobia bacterium ADurb.Bin070]|nr:MAG: hypothetical protein BWX70_03060 [Verrucomicrobia bacterium ADurb.Bin070]